MPGASKSKYSKQGREARQRYGTRNVGTRPTLPIVVIVCDDTNTAPAYFAELKREVRQHVTLNIVRAACGGASPDTVLQQGISQRRVLAEDRDVDDQDVGWVLIDLEGDAERRRPARAAKDRVEQGNVKVALSDPCYEVWTLLHLEDSGAQFNNCRDVLARVKRLWKTCFGQSLGRKAQADYSKIITLRHDAAKRAEAHWNRNDPSRTEVFKIIQNVDACLEPNPEPPNGQRIAPDCASPST